MQIHRSDAGAYNTQTDTERPQRHQHQENTTLMGGEETWATPLPPPKFPNRPIQIKLRLGFRRISRTNQHRYDAPPRIETYMNVMDKGPGLKRFPATTKV